MMKSQRILRIAILLSLAVLPFATGCFSMTGALVGGTVGGGVGLVSGTTDGKPGEGLRNGFSDGMMAGMLVGGEIDMAILEPFDDWGDDSRSGPDSLEPNTRPMLAVRDVIQLRESGTSPALVVQEIEQRGTSEQLTEPTLRLLASHRIEVEIIDAMHANYRGGPPSLPPLGPTPQSDSGTISQSVGYPPPSLPYIPNSYPLPQNR